MTTRETGPTLRPPTSPSDLEIEQEIDLGRYWRALAWRWWLPLAGAILGGVIGFAVTSVARPYRSDVVVYLGQPLYNGQPLQTVGTNFQFMIQLLTSTAVVRSVAARAGVTPAELKPAISVAAFTPEGPARAGTPARIVTISATGFSPSKGSTIVSALAKTIIDNASDYVRTKVSVYEARLARTVRELKLVQKRQAAALAGQSEVTTDRSITGAEKLILLAHYDNLFNANESRRLTLESAQLALRDQLALSHQVELPRVLEPTVSVKEAAPSRRSRIAVGAVIGLVVGVLAALLWDPVATRLRRRAPT